MAGLFTLTQGRWYAMTMYPGYTDDPYRSPIEVNRIHLLGNHTFRLDFWNVGYAQGVQGFQVDYRTLRRHETSLIAQQVDNKERTVIFERLTGAWIGAFVPQFSMMLVQAIEREQVFSNYDKPRTDG